MQTFQKLIKRAVNENAMCLRLISSMNPIVVFPIQSISWANEPKFDIQIIEAFRKMFFKAPRTNAPEQTEWEIPNFGKIIVISQTVPEISLSFYLPAGYKLLAHDWNMLQAQYQQMQQMAPQPPAMPSVNQAMEKVNDVNTEEQVTSEEVSSIPLASVDDDNLHEESSNVLGENSSEPIDAPALKVEEEKDLHSDAHDPSNESIPMFVEEDEVEEEAFDPDEAEKQFIPTVQSTEPLEVNNAEPEDGMKLESPVSLLKVEEDTPKLNIMEEPSDEESAPQEYPSSPSEITSSILQDELKEYMSLSNGLIIVSGSAKIDKTIAMNEIYEAYSNQRQSTFVKDCDLNSLNKEASDVVLVTEHVNELDLIKAAGAGYLVFGVLHNLTAIGAVELLLRQNLSYNLAQNLHAIIHYEEDGSYRLFKIDDSLIKLIKNSDINGLEATLSSLLTNNKAA